MPDPIVRPLPATQPEDEVLMADSVGLALLVVLDTLSPDERLAFVLTTCSTFPSRRSP